MFVDRNRELACLDEAWKLRPCLVVVYGRRRVGKTRLVLEWLRSRGLPGAYYHAVPGSHDVNLAGLAKALEAQLGLRGFSRARYEGLDVLLELASRQCSEMVVVIDEFTYWVRSEPRVVGELQRFVDHHLGETRMLLILVGSLVGVMARTVVGGGAPLYGRARLRLHVTPLEPWHVAELHPWLPLEDTVRVYGLFGGIPYYHSMIQPSWSLHDVLEKLVLSPYSPLRDEVLFILRDELRNIAPYYSILRAVAQGYNTISQISDATGIPRSHLPRYIRVLELLGMIEHVRPLEARKGWYRVKDPIARTWFRIVEPLLPLIESQDTARALSEARQKLETLMGEVFEDVARAYVAWLASRREISYTRIGRYSYRGIDIDLVAVDDRERVVHLFEVKWSRIDHREAVRIARRLLAKHEETPYRDYTPVAHIIVRSYEGPPPEEARIHTLHDMPFPSRVKPGQREAKHNRGYSSNHARGVRG